ncbi:Rha family transcriptional regulator [Photobacterium toruni]|uniref:Rha family transcriptional regulator n=1 Tax=Photobacterium toruni TaxID=1935446 RepID=UPI00211081F5|nr:phage antirepressor KilAC domain-containing protein [Photobacterium toruni]
MNALTIQNEMTMSSRDISELTNKRHDNVMRDIENMLDALNLSRLNFEGGYLDSNNQQRKCYNLPRRECEILVTGYDVARRAAVIDRWFQLESNQTPVLPASFADALQLAADQARQIEQQQQQIAIAAPKVDFAERIAKVDQGIKLGEYAKAVNLGPHKIFAILRDMKILISGCQGYNLPMQQYIDSGYFIVRQSTYGPEDDKRIANTALITGKGELWLTNKLVKSGVLKAVAA